MICVILLGVDADDKIWIISDAWIFGKFLVCHNVLHKLFWRQKRRDEMDHKI